MLHRSPKFRFSPSSPLKRGQHWLWIAALIIIFFIGYTIGTNMYPTTSAMKASSIPTTTAIVSTPDPPATPTPPSTVMHYKVGQTLQINGTWQVTVASVRTGQDDQHTKPKPGNSFLLINVAMKNISSQPLTISSLKQYTLRDTTGQAYAQTPPNGTTSPDGTLQAGAALQGTLTYEVPATIHTYILGFMPAENSQQVIWDVQN